MSFSGNVRKRTLWWIEFGTGDQDSGGEGGGGSAVFSTEAIAGLRGWWKLDEATNDAIDAHTTGHNLTDSATTPGSQAGLIGNERTFLVASNQYFEEPNAAWFETFNTDHWCSFVGTIDDTANFQNLVSVDNAADRHFTIYLNPFSGPPQFELEIRHTLGGIIVPLLASPTVGQRYRFQSYLNTATNLWTITIDGVEYTQDVSSITLPAHSGVAALSVGKWGQGGGGGLNGKIDEMFLVGGYSPTAEEVSAVYNGGSWITYEQAVGS